MCWKRYEPDPPPTPSPMEISHSSTEGWQSIVNATEGGIRCPEEATKCSNITSSLFECHRGICCEHNGEPLCSCEPGWIDSKCDIQDDFQLANSGPVYRPPDVLPTGIQITHIFLQRNQAEGVSHYANSQHMLIIGVLITLLLVGILTITFLVYKKMRSRNNRNQSSTPNEQASLHTSRNNEAPQA